MESHHFKCDELRFESSRLRRQFPIQDHFELVQLEPNHRHVCRKPSVYSCLGGVALCIECPDPYDEQLA